MTEITEKKKRRTTPRVTLPASPTAPGAQAPLSVRQYAMPADSRDRWMNDHTDDSTRVKLRTERAEKQQLMQQLRGKIRNLSLLIAILLILFVLLVVLQLTSSLFVIREITVIGTDRYSAKELSEAGGFGQGTRMRELSCRDAEEKILRAYPEFSDCTVETDLNGSAVIRMTKNRPVLYFVMAGRYYAVTEDLCVTESADSPDAFVAEGLLFAELPGIAAAVEGQKLEFLAGTGEFITSFLHAANEQELLRDVGKLSFANRFSIVAYGKDGGEIHFGSVEKISTKMQISERLKAENGKEETAMNIDVSEPDAVLWDYVK